MRTSMESFGFELQEMLRPSLINELIELKGSARFVAADLKDKIQRHAFYMENQGWIVQGLMAALVAAPNFPNDKTLQPLLDSATDFGQLHYFSHIEIDKLQGCLKSLDKSGDPLSRTELDAMQKHINKLMEPPEITKLGLLLAEFIEKMLYPHLKNLATKITQLKLALKFLDHKIVKMQDREQTAKFTNLSFTLLTVEYLVGLMQEQARLPEYVKQYHANENRERCDRKITELLSNEFKLFAQAAVLELFAIDRNYLAKKYYSALEKFTNSKSDACLVANIKAFLSNEQLQELSDPAEDDKSELFLKSQQGSRHTIFRTPPSPGSELDGEPLDESQRHCSV